MSIDQCTLTAVRKIQDLWRAGKSDSLIDYTQESRVEPIVLIGTDVLFNEMLPEVMQSALTIFAGYYLQAIAISMNIGNIEVQRTLSKLNPKRSAADAAGDTAGWLMARENYTHRLPTPGAKAALEAIADRIPEAGSSTFTVSRDTNSELTALSNLSVGKMLMVEIGDGLHKGTSPVSVRLQATSIPTERLAHILAIGTDDTSMVERFHRWYSGELEFIRDIVYCEDLIETHRKNLKADKDGVYSQILSRARENQLSALVSANPSVATASNIVVISSETARELELQVNGKLSNPSIRDKIFKGKYMMILVVLDTSMSRVTFYHRGIAQPTELGMRDLRGSNRDGGPNVSDVLKAYQLGNAPSL
jgi:hypothetical protein